MTRRNTLPVFDDYPQLTFTAKNSEGRFGQECAAALNEIRTLRTAILRDPTPPQGPPDDHFHHTLRQLVELVHRVASNPMSTHADTEDTAA